MKTAVGSVNSCRNVSLIDCQTQDSQIAEETHIRPGDSASDYTTWDTLQDTTSRESNDNHPAHTEKTRPQLPSHPSTRLRVSKSFTSKM